MIYLANTGSKHKFRVQNTYLLEDGSNFELKLLNKTTLKEYTLLPTVITVLPYYDLEVEHELENGEYEYTFNVDGRKETGLVQVGIITSNDVMYNG